MRPCPKILPTFNEPFLKHVRCLPCAVCEAQKTRQLTPTQAAHIRKASINGDVGGQVMRLCVLHHQIQHSTGIKRFLEWALKIGVDLRADAKRICEEFVG